MEIISTFFSSHVQMKARSPHDRKYMPDSKSRSMWIQKATKLVLPQNREEIHLCMKWKKATRKFGRRVVGQDQFTKPHHRKYSTQTQSPSFMIQIFCSHRLFGFLPTFFNTSRQIFSNHLLTSIEEWKFRFSMKSLNAIEKFSILSSSVALCCTECSVLHEFSFRIITQSTFQHINVLFDA